MLARPTPTRMKLPPSHLSEMDVPFCEGVRFLPVVGFPGYAVGDNGTVWSRWKQGHWTTSRMSDMWAILRPGKEDKGGHLFVGLSPNSQTRRVHCLVLQAFVGPAPVGTECCHDDGNPANNNLSNLRWDTKKGNADDRARHGRTARGVKHGCAKIGEGDVRLIREMCDAGLLSHKQIGRKFGLADNTVSLIWRRKIWKHVV